MADIEQALQSLRLSIESKDRQLHFNGPYDKNDAILTIQAGAGGTDAQDWAQMLERMYARYAEANSWKVNILDRSAGEEAGIKSSTFEIKGRFVYGMLKNEQGVHRLVRLSPFNADNLRQTSFARIEVIPKLAPRETPAINPQDLEVQTYRASGAGGQHVNKTSSAVRIKHLPTGLTVTCQSQRSQAQNKAQAMAVLAGKLKIMADQQNLEKIDQLRGEIKTAAWGNQIRSYVLHPYTMVKDHRSGISTSDAKGVLDGNLSLFVGNK